MTYFSEIFIKKICFKRKISRFFSLNPALLSITKYDLNFKLDFQGKGKLWVPLNSP